MLGDDECDAQVTIGSSVFPLRCYYSILTHSLLLALCDTYRLRNALSRYHPSTQLLPLHSPSSTPTAQVLTLALYDSDNLPDFPTHGRLAHSLPHNNMSDHRNLTPHSCGIVVFTICRLRVIPIVMPSRADIIYSLSAQPFWLSVVRIACNSDETSPLLEDIRKVFDAAAFPDDVWLWPQYQTYSNVGVLPPLTGIVANVGM